MENKELTEEEMLEVAKGYDDLTDMFEGLTSAELLKFMEKVNGEGLELTPVLAFSLGRAVGRKEGTNGRVQVS